MIRIDGPHAILGHLQNSAATNRDILRACPCLVNLGAHSVSLNQAQHDCGNLGRLNQDVLVSVQHGQLIRVFHKQRCLDDTRRNCRNSDMDLVNL